MPDEPRKEKVPTNPITVVNIRYAPSAISHTMDVDQIHGILRSAEAGDTRNLFALYRDIISSHAHLQGEFSKRKLAVLGDEMSILPADDKLKPDVDLADAIRSMIAGCRSWLQACSHLMDGCLHPVSLVEKVWSVNPSRPYYSLAKLIAVPHYLLDFMQGDLRVFDVDPTSGAVLTTSHLADESRYIIHRGHILTAPDCWGGPMRAILFWWMLSTMDREWWARFLDRYGSPFLKGTYPSGDHESRSVLERAFALSVKLGGLVVSEGTTVELVNAAASSSGDSYQRFYEICNREMSKLVIGQTLSAEAQSTGLGSGVSEQQENVRQDIRKFDAAMLSQTLRDQLFTQFAQVNGYPGAIPTMGWGADSAADIRATTALLQSLGQAGLEPTDEGVDMLSRKTGIPLQRRASPAVMPFAVQEVGGPRPFHLPPRRRPTPAQ